MRGRVRYPPPMHQETNMKPTMPTAHTWSPSTATRALCASEGLVYVAKGLAPLFGISSRQTQKNEDPGGP